MVVSESMSASFALFFFVLLGALVGINAFVYRRANKVFALSQRGRRVVAAVMVTSLAAMVIGRAVAGWTGDDMARTIGGAGMMIELALLIAFVLLALERLAALAMRAGAALRNRLRPPATPTEEEPENAAPVLGRRELMSRAVAGAALGIGASSSVYGTLWGRHDYVIEEVPIRLAKLPPTLEGFSIVQLSDLHLGTFVGEREMRDAVELVAQAKPDLIVLTGDHLDHDARYTDLLGSLVTRLRELAPVAAVPGNHDYYAGIGAMTSAMQRAGAELLVNRSLSLGDRGGRIAVCGVDDVWARRQLRRNDVGPDLARALANVPDAHARILLCHNPVFFPEAAPHVDLQLSGHTHGGQFNPGVRPAQLLLPFGYVAGRYTRGDAQLYVNRGFGTAGPPARLGSPPEVTKIILTG